MPTGFYGMLFCGSTDEAEEAIRMNSPIAIPHQIHRAGSGNETMMTVCSGPAEQLPLIYTDTADIVSVFSGVLYNRDDLARELSCAGQAPDGRLLQEAWRQWGDDTPRHLNGDWMFAIYLKPERELYLARSWGFSSMYYRQGRRIFAFSTNLNELIELEQTCARPDLRFVVRILRASSVPGAEESPYEEIRQLPPASMLHLKQGQLQIKEFWRPHWIPRQSTVNEAEALETFVDLYAKAVRNRLVTNGNTGATLSAGLDSGSICALAARELRETDKKLYAWTSVPQYPSEAYAMSHILSDESTLASRVSAAYPNIVHRLVTSAESNPILSICRQEALTGRPQWTCANYYWMEDILALAAGQDCGAVLLGQSGNGTVSWSPHRIAFLPKQLYFPGISMRKYLKYSRQRLRQDFTRIKKELSHRLRKPQDLFPNITPKLLHSALFKQASEQEADRRPKGTGQAALQEQNMGLFDTHYHMGFLSGVSFRDPTNDLPLSEFLLSLPERMYFRDGLDRRVLRLGMKGIMPEENRLNRRRGRQGSDILPRLRAHTAYAQKALDYIGQSPMAADIINLSYMRDILNRLKKGETGAPLMLECTRFLLPGFSCGFFLANNDLRSRFEA
jgi:asparagine synthase (glutamine-hydrolysing)